MPWYAVRVKPRQEKQVAVSLNGKGYIQFCPLYRVGRTSSGGRKSYADLPLFNGYLFVRLDIHQRLPVLQIPGVMHFVGAGKQSLPVDEDEIKALQAVAASGVPAVPWPFIKIGQRVVIEKGALKGVEGILTQAKNAFRIVVSISLLHRSVSVEIDRDIIRPLHSSINGSGALRQTAGQ